MLACRGSGRWLTAGIAFLSLVVAARAATAAPPDSSAPDEFFAKDKTTHFVVAGGIAGTGYGVTTAFAKERWKAFAVGGGAALALGALKEGYDGLGKGDPSWKDLTWDAIGAAAGLAVAFVIDVAIHGGEIPPLASRSSLDWRAAPRMTPLLILF